MDHTACGEYPCRIADERGVRNVLVSKTEQYYKTPFDSEAELEQVVSDYSEQLFGANALFLPKAKISTLGGAGTIPDGFAIDIESGDWYIVEAELASHGIWQHIAPQISKQIAALDAPKTREAILALALNAITENEQHQEAIAELGIADIAIHGYLQAILKQPPVIAIPIDSVPRDLESWASSLRFDVRIWVIEKYVTLDGERILYSLPEESSPTVATEVPTGSGSAKITIRSSQPYQDVISAGLLGVGQKIVMKYGPRGSSKQIFHGVLREAGVELDGRIMSLSAAAVYCMQKAGSHRHTANGWKKWRTEDGETLNEVYNQFYSREAENDEVK